ncbi:MAG: hypothetical protein ACUVQY_02805 [Thermoproteota archaeon]
MWVYENGENQAGSVPVDVRRHSIGISLKNRFRPSFWSVGLIMLYVIMGIPVYFWEPTLASLFFLGSSLSFSVGYFLGACIEQFGFRSKLLLALSLSHSCSYPF